MSEPEKLISLFRVTMPGKTLAGGAAVVTDGMKEGVWVGPNTEGSQRIHVEDDKLSYVQFGVDPQIYKQAYKLASEEIWLSFHGVHRDYPEKIPAERIAAYETISYMVASEIKDALTSKKPSNAPRYENPNQVLILLQDYHEMAVASSLKALGVKNPIGLFLHTPFPSESDLEVLPHVSRGQVEKIMTGLLDLDLVGFQRPSYRDHFMEFAKRHGAIQTSENMLLHNGHEITTGVFPVGIDPSFYLTGQLPDAKVYEGLEKYLSLIGNRQMALAVDRGDPAKNGPLKMRAFDQFLREFEGADKDACLVMVVPKSREDSSYYADERRSLREAAAYVNASFGTPEHPAVILIEDTLEREQLKVFQGMAHAFVVNSKRDGMHLGPFEIEAAKHNAMAQNPAIEPAALIVSEGAGVSSFFKKNSAIHINGDDVNALAAVFGEAFTMTHDERLKRHEANMQFIQSNTNVDWMNNIFDALENTSKNSVLNRAQPSHYQGVANLKNALPAIPVSQKASTSPLTFVM